MFKDIRRVLVVAAVIAVGSMFTLAIGDVPAQPKPPIGGTVSKPASTPAGTVVGWRGDWTGRYPDANLVTQWGYWPKSPNYGLRYQLNKPAQDDAGKDTVEVKSRQLQEWLVLGPFEPRTPRNHWMRSSCPIKANSNPMRGIKPAP
jgi:hypothetical protein